MRYRVPNSETSIETRPAIMIGDHGDLLQQRRARRAGRRIDDRRRGPVSSRDPCPRSRRRRRRAARERLAIAARGRIRRDRPRYRRRPGDDVADDRRGILAPRVVRRDDDTVGERGRVAPSPVASPVAVAPHPNTTIDRAPASPTRRAEQLVEPVGRVRVVDDDARTCGPRSGDDLEPPGHRSAGGAARPPTSASIPSSARSSAASEFDTLKSPPIGTSTACRASVASGDGLDATSSSLPRRRHDANASIRATRRRADGRGRRRR